MRLVKEYMSRPVWTVESSATMAKAAKLMRKHRIGSLVIVEGDKPIGIITERDIAYKVVADELGLDTKVSEAMTTDLKTVVGETGLRDAAKLMASHLIRRLPVLDDGKLMGIITIDDIMRGERIEENLKDYTYS